MKIKIAAKKVLVGAAVVEEMEAAARVEVKTMTVEVVPMVAWMEVLATT